MVFEVKLLFVAYNHYQLKWKMSVLVPIRVTYNFIISNLKIFPYPYRRVRENLCMENIKRSE